MKSLFLLLLFIFSLHSRTGTCSPCCGAGFAAPSLILGEELRQLVSSYSIGQVETDVDARGIWRPRSYKESIETLRLDFAQTFLDRFQVGTSIPLTRRQRGEDSVSRLGDVGLSLGYELWTDWEYRAWRPKWIPYLSGVLPAGTSVYEMDFDQKGLDVSGRGFWALGLGSAFVKNFGRFDVSSIVEIQQPFAKNENLKGRATRLSPGVTTQLAFSVGYRIMRWRIGVQVQSTALDPVHLNRGNEDTMVTSGQRFVTASLMAHYRFSSEWTLGVSYFDQTTFGSPLNSSLNRGLMFQLAKIWLR